MADLAAVDLNSVTGITDLETIDTAATSTGDTAPCGPGYFLAVLNGDASSKTITVDTPGTTDGLAIANPTLVVPAGKWGLLALRSVFKGASGRATITYSAVTSVTVAVIKLKL